MVNAIGLFILRGSIFEKEDEIFISGRNVRGNRANSGEIKPIFS